MGTNVIVHIDHVALRYLIAKKDSLMRLIRWVLLFQEFYFEVKDRKGCENKVANHLLLLDTKTVDSKEHDIVVEIPDERVIRITYCNTPCYADLANYVVCILILEGLTFYQKNHSSSYSKWAVYLRECADIIIRWCIQEVKFNIIQNACHASFVGE